jgi:hypothetical protein
MRFALVLALSLAAPAIAHNRIEQCAPALDLRFEVDAHESVQPLRIVPRDLFADGARVELPLSRSPINSSAASALGRHRIRHRPSASSLPPLTKNSPLGLSDCEIRTTSASSGR